MNFRGRRRKRELATAIERSRGLLMSGQHEENFKFLEEAVRQFPDDPEIRLLYATTLLEYRVDDVASEASKAVELAPDNPRILVRAAHLMLGGGEVESARSCAIRADELAPPAFVLRADLINLKGLLAACDGQDDLAEERLRSALESQPANGPFAVDLARFLAARGRHSEAVEVIDQTLARTSNSNLERVRAELVDHHE